MTGEIIKLKAKRNTYLKAALADSSELPDSQKRPIEEDQEIDITDYRDAGKGHHQISLRAPIGGIHIWYIYTADNADRSHWEPWEDTHPTPKDKAVVSVKYNALDRGPQITVPGRGKVYLYDPVQSKSPHFSWAEFTHGGARIPVNEQVTANMEKLALKLAPVRDKWGPMKVTSGYRPEPINSQVGGVPNSIHTTGGAIDLYPTTKPAKEFENWCYNTGWLEGGLGLGADYRGFIHLDIGSARVWAY
jgi:hypothetical protein